MQINGEAIVRSDNDIRITGVKIINQTNNAYETYNNKYTKETTSMFVTLPSNSSITYEVEITNKSDKKYSLTNIEILSNTNNNITYEISANKYDIYESNTVSKINIFIKNDTDDFEEEILAIKFTFKESQATFLAGSLFNAKIKQLATNDNSVTHLTSDTEINKIVRASELNVTIDDSYIISTADSTVPIYAWYDSGIIYYYSKINELFLNADSSYMFYNLTNLDDISFDNINSSKVISMQKMFQNCFNIKNLDLSNFNTSNVTNMSQMFYACKELEEVNVSSFNTSNVTSMYQMFTNNEKLKKLNLDNFDTSKVVSMQRMFYYDYKLTELNISNFNTSKVENMLDMFANCSSLKELDISTFNMNKVTSLNTNGFGFLIGMSSLEKLKTPKVYPNGLSITLPKTLYDENSNSYTILDSTSPIQTWLKVNE